MTYISIRFRHAIALCTTAALLAGCSGASMLPAVQTAARPNHVHAHAQTTNGYVYVSNRTQKGSSELLVYPSGVQNATPTRTITNGLVDVGGISVDSTGNLYVANRGAGNVLEFAPGATSLIQTYSTGLVHPTDVTVANGTLYVADQGDVQNGYTQQIMEYAVGNSNPLLGTAGLGSPPQLNEGIAVNPAGLKGQFFASASNLTGIPPAGGCPGTYIVAQNLSPILWRIISLSQNQQAWGMAFDAKGNLYVSDVCANDVAIYSDIGYVWTYSGKVSGTFRAPLFLTIENQFLAVPNAGVAGSSSRGFVSVIDLTKRTSTVTITSGLQYPVGAAVGSAP